MGINFIWESLAGGKSDEQATPFPGEGIWEKRALGGGGWKVLGGGREKMFFD